jgi:DNA end-binding protein Ku
MVTATRSHDIRMHLVHAADGARLKQQRICSADGEVIEWDDVDRGVERADGTFVRITDEELGALAAEKSRAMEIEDVVPLEQIDPMFVEKSWFLVPVEGGARGYALLASALAGTGRAAIARLTMRGRQQLVSIRSIGNGLVVESLRYADEVVAFEEVLPPEQLTEAREREVEMAKAFLESLEVDFDPTRYEDEYQKQLAALIERKAAEGDFAMQPVEDEQPMAPVVDIMAALEASLKRQQEQAGEQLTKRGGRTAASTRKTTASTKAATNAKPKPAAKRAAKR